MLRHADRLTIVDRSGYVNFLAQKCSVNLL